MCKRIPQIRIKRFPDILRDMLEISYSVLVLVLVLALVLVVGIRPLVRLFELDKHATCEE